MSEHKLCPFCGGKPELFSTKESRFIRSWIKCDSCNCKTYTYLMRDEKTNVEFLSEEELWKFWDRRCDRS